MDRNDDNPAEFSQGETVTWNPHRLSDPAHPRKRYGEGPFAVVSAERVPSQCSFPLTFCAIGPHSEHCNISIRRSMGHPQWVVVRLPNGEVPQDSVTRRDARLSGAWFVHA